MQRSDAAALHEDRRAGAVELQQLAGGFHGRGRQHQPAQAPAGHQEALAETVHDDEAVRGRRDVQEGGRRSRSSEIDPFVDLVGHDPGAGVAAVIEHHLLLGAREGPAGGVVGRIDQQHAGARRHCRQQLLQVELPRAPMRPQRHPRHAGAQDRRLCREVGPHRHHGHDLVPVAHQHLHRQHQRAHARRGDGHAPGIQWLVQSAAIGGDGRAQFRQPEVVRIEGLAACQRFSGGLAHRLRRDFVALAEPEGEHVVASDTGIGHFTDLGTGQVPDGVTHRSSFVDGP